MTLDIPTLKGAENLNGIFDRVVQATIDQDITDGYDLDGTVVHAVPGEHVNVPQDPALENMFNTRNIHTDGGTYSKTGRPRIFTTKLMPNAKILVGTEHGGIFHLPDGTDIIRAGDPEAVKEVLRLFSEVKQTSELLKRVQIEDHKQVSGTIGFTHIINPHSLPEINQEAIFQMEELTKEITDKLTNTIERLGFSDLQVVPTVTPTNAVIELLFEGSCKAESVLYARDNGLLKRANTNVFCGDSDGDRSVMEMISKEPGGICIGVGPKAP